MSLWLCKKRPNRQRILLISPAASGGVLDPGRSSELPCISVLLKSLSNWPHLGSSQMEPSTSKPSSSRKQELMCSVSHPVVEIFAARKKSAAKGGNGCGAAAAAALPERIKMQVFQCCVGEMVLSIFISKPFLCSSRKGDS